MSASQQKKMRMQTRDEDLQKALAEEKAANKKKTLKRIRNIAIAVIVVAVIAAIVVIDSDVLYTNGTAVDFGGNRYTAAETNYIYKSVIYSFVNTQTNYASQLGMTEDQYLEMMGLDMNSPLDEQPCYLDSSLTWEEYFINQATDSLKQMTALCDAAEAAGYELSEEDEATIEENLSYIEYYAQMYGATSEKQYLVSQYGKGVTEKVVRKMMTMSTIAGNYSELMQNSFSYTDEEKEAWYDEHKDQYDYVTYLQYFFDGSVDESIEEPTDADKEAAMADAKKLAEEMAAAVTDEDSFIELANAASAEGTTTEEITGLASGLSSVYSEWMLDESRKSGDVESVESTNGYYVVMFISRENNHYNLQQVRHLLVKAVADDDGVYTDEAKAAAKEQAEAYLQEWKDGEATEESFAEMATQYSDDTASTDNGGLYDEVMKGSYVQEFEDFAFASGRKYGDTDIVYGEVSGSYAGYHVMYYVGEGELYSNYIANNMKRTEDYNAWEENLLSAYAYTSGNRFSLVG